MPDEMLIIQRFDLASKSNSKIGEAAIVDGSPARWQQ